MVDVSARRITTKRKKTGAAIDVTTMQPSVVVPETSRSLELTGLLTGEILPASYTRPRYRAPAPVGKGGITINQLPTVGGNTVMCTPQSAIVGSLSSYAERLALTASALQQRLLPPFAQQQAMNGAAEAGVAPTIVQQMRTSGAVSGTPSLVISQAPIRLQPTEGAADNDDAATKQLKLLTASSNEHTYVTQAVPAALLATPAQTASGLTAAHPSTPTTQKSFVLSQGGTLVPVTEGQRVLLGGAASSLPHFTLAGHATQRPTARLVSLCVVDHGSRLSADSEQAIQKLQFHDFPLTTQSSSTMNLSQAAAIARCQLSHTLTASRSAQSIVATGGRTGHAIVVTDGAVKSCSQSIIVSGGTCGVSSSQTIVVAGGYGKSGQSLMSTGGSVQDGGASVVKIGHGAADNRIMTFTSQVGKKQFVMSSVTKRASSDVPATSIISVATEPLGKVASIVESPPGVVKIPSVPDVPSLQSSVVTTTNKSLSTASVSTSRGGRVGAAVTVAYVTKPAVTAAYIAKPAVTVSHVTKPAVTVSHVTKPAVTVSHVTKPAVTVSHVTKPAVPIVTTTRTRRIKTPKHYDL